jgi:hypothetical protein
MPYISSQVRPDAGPHLPEIWDLLREVIRAFAQEMMDAEAEAICGAGTGRRNHGPFGPKEFTGDSGSVFPGD